VGRHTSIRSSPGGAKEDIRDDVYRLIGLKSLLDAGRPCRHQIQNPTHFSNSPLQFFSCICYKQSTESRCVWQPVIVCISRVRPASK
jgi:hypothetical protein